MEGLSPWAAAVYLWRLYSFQNCSIGWLSCFLTVSTPSTSYAYFFALVRNVHYSYCLSRLFLEKKAKSYAYRFITITTTSLDLSAKNMLILLVVLVFLEESFLLANELDVLHGADLSVANWAHVQNLTVCLEVLQSESGRMLDTVRFKILFERWIVSLTILYQANLVNYKVKLQNKINHRLLISKSILWGFGVLGFWGFGV